VILVPLVATLQIALLVNFALMVLTHLPLELHLVLSVGVVVKQHPITALVCSVQLDTTQKRMQVVNNVLSIPILTLPELALATLAKQVQKWCPIELTVNYVLLVNIPMEEIAVNSVLWVNSPLHQELPLVIYVNAVLLPMPTPLLVCYVQQEHSQYQEVLVKYAQ